MDPSEAIAPHQIENALDALGAAAEPSYSESGASHDRSISLTEFIDWAAFYRCGNGRAVAYCGSIWLAARYSRWVATYRRRLVFLHLIWVYSEPRPSQHDRGRNTLFILCFEDSEDLASPRRLLLAFVHPGSKCPGKWHQRIDQRRIGKYLPRAGLDT